MSSLSSLPSELIEEIFTHLEPPLSHNSICDNFKTFALLSTVSRGFYWPSKARLMKYISLNSEKEWNGMLHLLSHRNSLGELVRHLNVKFSAALNHDSESFIKLLQLLPNLQELSVSLGKKSNFKGLGSHSLPQFTSISTLNLRFSLGEKQDVIDQFVNVSPNLRKLRVAIEGFDQNESVCNFSSSAVTFSQFPFHSFSAIYSGPSINQFEWEAILLKTQYEKTLLKRFPPVCFVGLKELSLSGMDATKSILEVLKISSASLEKLDLESLESGLSLSLIPLISQLPSLQYLGLGKHLEVELA